MNYDRRVLQGVKMKITGPKLNNGDVIARKNSQPSFGLHKSQFVLKKDAQAKMLASMPKVTQSIIKLKNKMSEASNILINAMGTGLVAPIFIAFNPISKTDKDTKTYSALRQPISAVLSVVTQAGLVIPFDMLLNNMANKGKLGAAYDLRVRPDDAFVIRQMKNNQNLNLSKQDLKKRAADITGAKFEAAVTGVKAHKTIVIQSDDAKIIKMDDKSFKAVMDDTLDKIINNLGSEINEYEKIMLPEKTQRALFVGRNPELVQDFIDKANKIVASEKSDTAIAKEFKSLIKDLKQEKAPSQLIELAQEVKQLDEKSKIVEKLDKTAKKISIFKGKTDEQIKTIVKDYVHSVYINKAKVQRELYSALKEKIKSNKSASLIYDEICKVTEEFDKGIKNSKAGLQKLDELFGSDKVSKSISKLVDGIDAKRHKYLIQDVEFTRAVVRKHINTVKSKVKAFKAVTGLILSMAMLPFTCSALNWVYPRFMEWAFPNLSHSKKKGGAE